MRTNFFNEAIVTGMLAAASGEGEETARSGPGGADPAGAEALRERLLALLDRADRTAAQAGIPADLVEAADFAASAFIDEVLLSSVSWRGRMDWLQKPLQFVRHGTATAGEDFYRLLDSLLEQAAAKAPFAPLAEALDAAGQPREDADARSPLHAILEIFALCLAQGFTGMFYDDPKAIRDRLDKIGRFVPAVNRRAAPFFFAPADKTGKRRPMRHGADLVRRFDLLDLGLWLVPPVLTLLLYYVCQIRLDRLLHTFLQGSTLP